MLKHLIVHNYAIIEHLELEFAPGLNTITGETGAGKSILLGALGLILGNRADSKVLYDEAQKCYVEAIFDVSSFDLSDLYTELDLEVQSELTIRREISVQGKSRAFIEDSPVNLEILRKFARRLIDLHEQFDTLDIQEPAFQLLAIDAIAGNQELLRGYSKIYEDWTKAKKALRDLEEAAKQGNKEQDFNQYLWKELDEANLVAEEQEEMEKEYEVLSHASEIQEKLNQVLSIANDSEYSIQSQLKELMLALRDAAQYDSNLQATQERLTEIMIEFKDSIDDVQRSNDQVEMDPERIEQLQDRLQLIYKLQKKHQVLTVEELVIIRENLNDSLQTVLHLETDIANAKEQVIDCENELLQIANALHNKRIATIPRISDNIHAGLAELAMPYAQLSIELEQKENFTPTGNDQIKVLFAANKGSKLNLIKEVASGGELSRLALCFQSAIAGALALPTLIFDEIDSGVSGDVADKMGIILKKLSLNHQVLAITHSPQIAARGSSHFFVSKEVIGPKTYTRVKLLQSTERVDAIAVMLSTNPPSSTAIEHARELMNSN